MPNFTLGPVEVINTLQELLRDRYPEGEGLVTILNELLQNADDAEASNVQFIVLDSGLAAAHNSLLHGPALICINDGHFRPKDEEGLKRISGASKADEIASVGRFGLGQKSIFHLCEAWLYLGMLGETGEVRSGVLNPWADENGDPDHFDWDHFLDDDRVQVQRIFRGFLQRPNWLLLWIPLRQDHHRRGEDGLIMPVLHSSSKLWNSVFDVGAMVSVLPQLAFVRRIQSLHYELPGDNPVSINSIEVGAGSSGRLSRPRPVQEQSRTNNFHLLIEMNGQPTSEAWGVERFGNATALTEISKSPLWPMRLAHGAGARLQPLREKLAQHAAVTIVRQTSDVPQDSLSVSWAVFLPVNNGRYKRLTGQKHQTAWSIFLHGYFFPDSGRRNIPGIDQMVSSTRSDSPEALRHRWNALLRDELTLPSVVPALASAMKSLSPSEGESILKAFSQTEIFEVNREVIGGTEKLVEGLARQIELPF